MPTPYTISHHDVSVSRCARNVVPMPSALGWELRLEIDGVFSGPRYAGPRTKSWTRWNNGKQR